MDGIVLCANGVGLGIDFVALSMDYLLRTHPPPPLFEGKRGGGLVVKLRFCFVVQCFAFKIQSFEFNCC